MNQGGQPNNEIWYTTTDGVAVTLGSTDFGASILTHTYEDGNGRIIFDSAVTQIGYAVFGGCSTLASINLPNSISIISMNAFSDCTSLTSITIPYGVTSIGWYAFSGCSSLTSITVPNSVTDIGAVAFGDCESLVSVYINDLASWCSIQFGDPTANPLHNGASLYVNGQIVPDDWSLPDSVTYISDYAFYGLGIALYDLKISSKISHIGMYAFNNCKIYYLTIDGGLYGQIGDYAFASDELSSVAFKGAPTMNVGTDIFGSNYSEVSIYVPSEYLEEYKALLPQYNIQGL
jgi:hypothetical protein